HVAEAERVGRGIILLHDSSEEEEGRRRNRTLELTRLLVPALKERGYRFVRLDAIPQVRSAVRVSCQLVLRAADGRVLSAQGEADAIVVAEAAGTREAFGVVELGGNRVALRAGNGQYLSAGPGGGPVRASAPEAGGAESFAREDLGGGRVAFRTARGSYLAPG